MPIDTPTAPTTVPATDPATDPTLTSTPTTGRSRAVARLTLAAFALTTLVTAGGIATPTPCT